MQYSRQNPSPRYLHLIEEYRKMHASGCDSLSLPGERTYSGFSTFKKADDIRHTLIKTPCLTLLDYGSGKGQQYHQAFISSKDSDTLSFLQDYWQLQSITCYDPAYPPFEQLPDRTFDAVICIDVLEHAPFEDLDWILHEIFSLANKLVYIAVACYTAKKTLSSGQNAHCTIQPPKWWHDKIVAIANFHPKIEWKIVCDK